MDLVGSWDAVERASSGLLEAGRVVEGPWGVPTDGSGSARVDVGWQQVSGSVADHLLAASATLVAVSAAAADAVDGLRSADRAAASGARAV